MIEAGAALETHRIKVNRKKKRKVPEIKTTADN